VSDDARSLLAHVVAALGGEERAGQAAMADAVEHALANTSHAMIQAGTGTGKSLGYLVPAVARAVREDERIVVSTATLALQRQVYLKDLPLVTAALAEPLGGTPRVGLLKGRANYLCRHKLAGGYPEPEDDSLPIERGPTSELGRQVARLHEWSEMTATGDRDDLQPGVPARAWAQVSVTAPNMTFADGSVNTGTASFTASASGTMRSIQVNGIGDISAPTVSLNGPTIGTSTNPLELGIGSTLNVNNTGGSTFIKSVSNDYTNIFLTNVKTVGTHAILFNDSASATVSDGDHIDYTTNGTDVFLPTIGGGASDGVTFGSTTGIDVTRRNRNVTLTAASGNIIFDNNSVNTRAGYFTAQIPANNPDGDIAALNAYNSLVPAAQITAGNVTFNVLNSSTPAASTIGAGTKDIQIAQGAGTSNNTLTVDTHQGSVTIHELSPNHFKTLNITLNSASAAQNVAIGLNGADDVNFSDSGSLVSIDATKVNLSANNRNWNLWTPNRSVQIDGVSLGSGSYTIDAGNNLSLNADVMTNGGAISLTSDDYWGPSTGIHLLKSVRIDSNADDASNTASNGIAGAITLNGTLMSSTPVSSRTLTVDSSSSTTGGGFRPRW